MKVGCVLTANKQSDLSKKPLEKMFDVKFKLEENPSRCSKGVNELGLSLSEPELEDLLLQLKDCAHAVEQTGGCSLRK